MKQQIRHRRLYAFYNSKVLNALYLVGIISLTQIGYFQSLIMPILFSSISFALFIGYSLWLWIRKPDRIVINEWLSGLTIWFTIYFLIISAMKDTAWWWHAFPMASAIIIMFINLVSPKDKPFNITQ